MPVNHKSWVTKELKTENGSLNYPVFYVFILNYIKSNKWDHLYINMFIIFLLLVIAFEDEWVDTYAPVLADVNADGILYIIIIVVMLVSQVIPSVGILYYINRCNDLTKYTASVDFPAWVGPVTFCIASALIQLV